MALTAAWYLVYAGAVLMDSALRDRLSEQERTMAHNVFVAMGKHLKTTALETLPNNYRSLVSMRLCLQLHVCVTFAGGFSASTSVQKNPGCSKANYHNT